MDEAFFTSDFDDGPLDEILLKILTGRKPKRD
jgi:hypothetical protein